MLSYKIIEGSIERADECREFCRAAYLSAYLRPDLGITEALFSEKVFSSERIKQYYRDLCIVDDKHAVWFVIDDTGHIIGVVAAVQQPRYCEMKCFYVRTDLRGQGIGHDLYRKVIGFAGQRQIVVDVVKYMQDTIDMYKHWGFKIDESRGELVYPITEWPEEARQAYKAIYMIKPLE